MNIKNFSGILFFDKSSTWYLIGCFWTIFFFEPSVAMASVLYLNIGDLSAAMVGKLIIY
jgi:dolichol kinase